IFEDLPDQKNQYKLGRVKKILWNIYQQRVISNPQFYNGYVNNMLNIFNPLRIKFIRIEGVGKKKVVVFDGKYDRCKECRRRRFYCDITRECQFCKINKIICDKPKIIRKRLYYDRTGIRYCLPINEHNFGTNRINLAHVTDIDNIGKRVCDKCRELKFCNANSMINNNCCGITTCQMNNVRNPMFTFNNIGMFIHHHVLCLECFNSCKKDILIILRNSN
ncbi:599_t:CDS:1, partial [Scutellospora calospora]